MALILRTLVLLLLAVNPCALRLSKARHIGGTRLPRRWQSQINDDNDAAAAVKERINAMRATAIKQALVSRGIDTRGLFDKAELAAALVRAELATATTPPPPGPSASIRTVPMFEVALGAATQSYVGIDLVIQGETLRFMMDTGATMNLIRPDTVQRLGIRSEQQMAYTVGVGGGGSVASRQTTVPNVAVGTAPPTFITLSAAILDQVPFTVYRSPFILHPSSFILHPSSFILHPSPFTRHPSPLTPHLSSVTLVRFDQPKMLPESAEGLLGLTFLQSVGDVVEFDFQERCFRFGPRVAMLSASRRNELHEVRTRRIYTGLIATDVYINGNATPVTAMVDMGAAHTIANPLAVQAITGRGIDALPTTGNMCAGIDGRPVAMRTLAIDRIQIGGQLTAQGPLSVYAADIPGMSNVGLGTVPAIILGMDVLGRSRLLLDIAGNSIYIPRNA